jgi:nitroreductase
MSLEKALQKRKTVRAFLDKPLSLPQFAQMLWAAYGGTDEGSYATMESGHMGQNIFLQAETLGLGAGIVGAFRDEEVRRVMGLPKEHEPLLIIPVGYKK